MEQTLDALKSRLYRAFDQVTTKVNILRVDTELDAATATAAAQLAQAILAVEAAQKATSAPVAANANTATPATMGGQKAIPGEIWVPPR